ncbi:MAG: aspartate carbamoyltransferase regulatory subunit [Candidatus Thorarchaeota archaeon]|nr:aspartate carbamoyltransferase regulatory subunit [Candidatus Thorarchaeota archaeon]
MACEEKSGKIRIVKIRNGTVIDHIRAGMALEVLQILGITGKEGPVVTLAMNISSNRIGRKDIVKLEDHFLEEHEVARIALVAPEATINLISEFQVVKKTRVQLPDTLTDIVICPNARCITNQEREPVKPSYQVVSRMPIRLKCLYCWSFIDEDHIVRQFTEHHTI